MDASARMRVRTGPAALAALAVLALLAIPETAAAGLLDRPRLDSISTAAAPVGSVVVLEGTGFGGRSLTSFVTFAGIKAQTTSWTDGRITAVVPPRAIPGYVGVTVRNVTSNGKWFAPSTRPVVVALSSSVGPVGSRLTLFGSGFGQSRRSGWVSFGGKRSQILYWSDRRIVATVPQGASFGFVGVWQNGTVSNGVLFTPFLPPNINASSARIAVVGSDVTVSGGRFAPTRVTTSTARPGVTISGREVEAKDWSEKHVTFSVPEDAQSGYIGVWREGVASNGFYLFVAPRVDDLSSWYGKPGTALTITGKAFGTDPGRVVFAGTAATIREWADTRIVVTIPEAREGYVGVWKGALCSNGKWFLPIVRPAIQFTSSTNVEQGASITINGAEFGEPAPTSEVRIGGAPCTIEMWSDTVIRARIPANAVTGYLGVWRRDVASNGIWTTVRRPDGTVTEASR